VQVILGVVSCHVRFMTADQPDKFLRMHLMTVAVGGILLRHRALVGALVGTLGAAIRDQTVVLRTFGGYRAHVRRNNGQLLASWN
jgi:hypothetical protein